MKLPEPLFFEVLLAPAWLWLVPGACLALLLGALLFAPPAWPLSAPAAGFGPRARRLPPVGRLLGAVALLLALCAAALALAQPAVRRFESIQRPGLDIVLCIDRSSSMEATDLDGQRTRLEIAKATAREFIRRRPQDRIGLVGFARYDDLLAPPTEDRAGLERLLEGLDPVVADGPEDATGWGAALARGAETLGRGQGRGRVLVLLTDGDENVAPAGEPDAIDPQQATQLAAALGVRVYAIAVGRAGPPGAQGARRAIDTRALRAAAERTGGVFFAAGDAAALEGVYAAIDLFEERGALDERMEFEVRAFPWLALAGGLLLLGLFIGRLAGEVWP